MNLIHFLQRGNLKIAWESAQAKASMTLKLRVRRNVSLGRAERERERCGDSKHSPALLLLCHPTVPVRVLLEAFDAEGSVRETAFYVTF